VLASFCLKKWGLLLSCGLHIIKLLLLVGISDGTEDLLGCMVRDCFLLSSEKGTRLLILQEVGVLLSRFQVSRKKDILIGVRKSRIGSGISHMVRLCALKRIVFKSSFLFMFFDIEKILLLCF